MPTTLSAGDIAFVDFASDNPKSFAFVLLTDVEAGTAINFTDNGWRADGSFRANEGVIGWTAEAALTAGTVVRLEGVQGGFNLSTSGDQILAYQGDAASPAFISAIQFNGADWDADATNSNSSALPAGLTDGVNAVSIANVDNGFYSGPTSGDPAAIRAALNDADNWTVNDNAPVAFDGSFAFVGSDEPAVSISVDPASAVEADGAFTFTIEATNLTEEIEVTVSFSGTTDADDFAGTFPADRVITLGPDNLSESFTITASDDDVSETDETLVGTIAVTSGTATVTRASATATILNDDFDDSDLTLISAIQGSGAASPMVGQTVTVEAIVVGDFQDGDADAGRDMRGFFLQHEQADWDDDASTSEGIFVFEGGSFLTDVAIGDRVRVTGVVGEYFGQTQLTAQSVSVVEAGAVEDINTMAVDVDLSAITNTTVNQDGDFQPDLEAYEGMLIRLPNTMTVTEQFQLDRFNEIKLFDTNGFEQVGANGETITGERPFTFSQHNTPDAAAYQAYLQETGARTITYDDGLNFQNQPIDNLFPDYGTATAPRMGDTIQGLTGVLDYQWAGNQASGATWRVRSVENEANEFTRGNGNPEPTKVTADGTGLKVASFNVLNFFTTLDGGGNTIDNGQDPRGANNAVEYQRQLDKLLVALEQLDSDIIGLIEIENDFDLEGNTPAVATLVEELNARAGSDVWAWVDPGRPTIGDDAIAVAQIYRTDTVQIAEGNGPNGQAIAMLETAGIFDATGGNRVPLTVTFEELASGEEITVTVNHFKSKGSASPGEGNADLNDGAGASNGTRINAAIALNEWLATNPTGSSTTNQVILGDLNSYAAEEPIQHLLDSGWVNLAARFLDNPYGYIFDGFVGTLDYILASGDMFADVNGIIDRVEDFVIGNINADEADALDYNTDFGRDPSYFDGTSPIRASDHDPLVASFNLGADQQPGNYTLQILHFSDGEASTLAPETAPLMAALVEAFEEEYANTIVLSGGDNFIAGPFLSAGADPRLDAILGVTAGGRADIEIHNRIGVDLSTVGNHEFDFGPDFFDRAISGEGSWTGALFPYLSANLNFEGTSLEDNFIDTFAGTGPIPTAGSLPAGAIAPITVLEEGGERIGFVGATTQILENIASVGGVTVADPGAGTDDMAALAAYLQPYIDRLTADGINKIILTSHLQDIANERELATLLTGVDVILAAGSNTRLGDENDVPREGEEFADTYPLVIEDAAGGTTLIVNTDGQYKYLGRLAIEFDAEGNVITDSYDPAVSGAYASTVENVAAAWGISVEEVETIALASGTRGGSVKEVTDAVNAVMEEINSEVIGYTNVALNGERNPGVRSEETNLGNITADANIAAGRAALETMGEDATFVVGIKNGGGIRAGINAGEITRGEANAALAFNNALMVFDTTAEGLLNILDAAAGVTKGNGAFIQLGGLRYSYDEGAASGDRVKSVALIAEDGSIVPIVENGAILEGAPSLIRVSILNFVAEGGELPVFKDNGENFRFIMADGTLSEVIPETADFSDASTLRDQSILERSLGEQQAFVDYITANYGTPETAYNEADTPEAQDERIQNLDLREDTVFEPALPPVGTPGDDIIVGTPGDDIIDGGAGFDSFVLAGNLADYSAEDFGQYVTIVGDGTDTLRNIDRLVFADGEIVVNDGDILFDSLFYMQQNADVYASGFTAIDHYRIFGASEGRAPNALFDSVGYLAANADVAAAGYDAFEHFRTFGNSEGRDPSLNFDARLYLQANQDVAAAGIDAFTHYMLFGRGEGRETFTAVGDAIEADGFDAQYYLLANNDVAAAGFDARTHYEIFGQFEGRDTSILFDTSYYLENNADVAASDINPLLHYQTFGWREGRDPSAAFDSSAYLAANDDVAAAGDFNPLTHYLTFGIYEGRAIDDVLVA
ncbi:ExeM/NucH family extracellular endonuclease [Aureimonas mangrovi]|uniref:ExeM/NucH family extracellular endonuclease n=1 Tax=Aureimonas mangrovi TaxID=2758041 RepID=UPI00163D8926|nr:ExeM/NucH family extracellular endonuclease [Aureimonas mangrovi]